MNLVLSNWIDCGPQKTVLLLFGIKLHFCILVIASLVSKHCMMGHCHQFVVVVVCVCSAGVLRCGKCMQAMSAGSCVQALGEHWHPKCFV